MEGTQAFDVEDDVLFVMVKGDEPAPKEENAPKSVEPDTILIEKVNGVTEPPSPLPATSSLYEAGGVTRVVGQTLTVAAAHHLNPMTAGAMKILPLSPPGVPLPWSSVVRMLGVVTYVGGQHQQAKAFEVKIAELGKAIGGQYASTLSPEMKEHQGVEGARAPLKEEDALSSGMEQESTPLAFVDAGTAAE